MIQVGFLAVSCRQTNIVWVCFIAFSMVLRQYYKSRGGSDGASNTLGTPVHINWA